jgi:hypothetical protein
MPAVGDGERMSRLCRDSVIAVGSLTPRHPVANHTRPVVKLPIFRQPLRIA